jgi:hypothetical protein
MFLETIPEDVLSQGSVNKMLLVLRNKTFPEKGWFVKRIKSKLKCHATRLPVTDLNRLSRSEIPEPPWREANRRGGPKRVPKENRSAWISMARSLAVTVPS